MFGQPIVLPKQKASWSRERNHSQALPTWIRLETIAFRVWTAASRISLDAIHIFSLIKPFSFGPIRTKWDSSSSGFLVILAETRLSFWNDEVFYRLMTSPSRHQDRGDRRRIYTSSTTVPAKECKAAGGDNGKGQKIAKRRPTERRCLQKSLKKPLATEPSARWTSKLSLFVCLARHQK